MWFAKGDLKNNCHQAGCLSERRWEVKSCACQKGELFTRNDRRQDVLLHVSLETLTVGCPVIKTIKMSFLHILHSYMNKNQVLLPWFYFLSVFFIFFYFVFCPLSRVFSLNFPAGTLFNYLKAIKICGNVHILLMSFFLLKLT